jgi:hypothetical protein
MSAVVVGCLAPDFEYFLPVGEHDKFGHSFTGTFELDLPLSLAVLWLFYRFAREPIAACLPKGARERLDRNRHASPMDSFAHFALTVLSILVGIATHLLWDAFTHRGSWITNHVHFLTRMISIPLFGLRPWYGILQYFSSAFGIVVILIWCMHWYRNTAPLHSEQVRLTNDRIAIAGLFLIAVTIALVRAAASGIPHGVSGSQRFMTDFAITGIPAFWIGTVIYGVVRNLSRKVIPVSN